MAHPVTENAAQPLGIGQPQPFDQFTRWACPTCGSATIDSFHKTVWDGLPWDGDTPPLSVPGITHDCGECCESYLVSYPAGDEAPCYIRTGRILETDAANVRAAMMAAEKAGWQLFADNPRAGTPLLPHVERDGDWSGGCLAITPAPPLSAREAS